jgi:hypothetical protein
MSIKVTPFLMATARICQQIKGLLLALPFYGQKNPLLIISTTYKDDSPENLPRLSKIS